jgi:hypothetical protein
MEFNDDIPQLATDGQNWSIWREKVETVIKEAGLHFYLDGTVSEPDSQLEEMTKFILTIGLPDLIFGSMLHLATAHDYYKYLTNRFDKPTVQPLHERLRKLEGCRDAEPQVAARTRKTFNGPCRKCGERGHTARECRIVGIESGSAKVENNPPEGLPSTSLEGGRTGASDELSEVPNDETTTSQSTWMPRDDSPSGEVHEVARSHEEAAGVDIEGGEAGERIRTGDDDESRAREHIDDRETETAGQSVDDEAADTPDPHAKCAEPTRPVGTSHDPADELFGEREGGGMGKPESVNPPIEGRRGRMPTDRADEAKPLGDDPNGTMAKVQGGGCRGGRGSGNSATNDASGESQRIALKALAEDGRRQCQERLANESSDSPEPPKPPDEPAQRPTQSPSVELEEERRAASSCDVERTIANADASGAPEDDGDDRERPMKLQTTLERVRESSERKGRDDSPREARVEQNDPDSEADGSAASGRVEGDWKQPKNLRNASEHERKRSKRRSREDSPGKARGDPDRPDGETAVPGDFQRPQERPTSVSIERVDDANAPRRRHSPGSHLGEPEASRGVEGVRDRGTVVDSAEHDRIGLSSDGNEREVGTNAQCRRNRPKGHLSKLKASKGAQGDWGRQTDVEDVGYDQERGEMGGATSGARRDSKRVETDPLAVEKEGQHERRKRRTSDVPRPSTPPPEYPRSLTDYVDQPRRRGRLKLRPRQISRAKMKRSTYRVVQPRRGEIGRIGCVGHVVCGIGMLKEQFRSPKCEDDGTRAIEDDRVRCSKSATLGEPRLAIYGNRVTALDTRSWTLNIIHLLNIHSSLEYERYTFI